MADEQAGGGAPVRVPDKYEVNRAYLAWCDDPGMVLNLGAAFEAGYRAGVAHEAAVVRELVEAIHRLRGVVMIGDVRCTTSNCGVLGAPLCRTCQAMHDSARALSRIRTEVDAQ